MEFTKESLLELLVKIAPNPYLQAILIVLISLGLAKLLDVIMGSFIKKWAQKTKVAFDDQIIDILHKPIFITIIIFGLGLAAERLEFKDAIHFITIAGLKTIVIIVWSIAVARLLKLFLDLVSHDESRFKLIQERTLSLFNNLLILIVTGLSIYIIFL
ncbi:MAG: hypothetical protein KAR45_22675, partial [Desulfobacteraceae bacterium]|nr:hypothetical protein [Desulfobacteraceae bacterium]